MSHEFTRGIDDVTLCKYCGNNELNLEAEKPCPDAPGWRPRAEVLQLPLPTLKPLVGASASGSSSSSVTDGRCFPKALVALPGFTQYARRTEVSGSAPYFDLPKLLGYTVETEAEISVHLKTFVAAPLHMAFGDTLATLQLPAALTAVALSAPADKRKSPDRRSGLEVKAAAAGEANVAAAKDERPLKRRRTGAAQHEPVLYGRPDFVATWHGRIVSVLEAWLLITADELSSSAAENVRRWERTLQGLRWQEKAEEKAAAEPQTFPPRTRRMLGQLLGYMLDNKVRCGVLSCFSRNWYFEIVEIEADGGISLGISDCWGPGEAQAASLLDSAAAVASLPAGSSSPAAPPSLLASPAPPSAVGVAAGQEAKVPTSLQCFYYWLLRASQLPPLHELPARENAGANSSEAESWSGTSRGSRDSVRRSSGSPPRVSFSALQPGALLGRGRAGDVRACFFGETPAVIKIFDFSKGCGRCYEREVKAYAAAKALQGVAVPRLLAVAESRSGNLQGIVLEAGQTLPSCFTRWSEEERAAAQESLRLLALAGLAQEDVRPENFVKCGDRVWAIDLEGCEPLTAQSSQDYLARLPHAFV